MAIYVMLVQVLKTEGFIIYKNHTYEIQTFGILLARRILASSK